MKDQIEERSSQLVCNLSSLSQRSWVQILFKPEFFFRLSFRNCLSCILTARIFLLFDVYRLAYRLAINQGKIQLKDRCMCGENWLNTIDNVTGALYIRQTFILKGDDIYEIITSNIKNMTSVVYTF